MTAEVFCCTFKLCELVKGLSVIATCSECGRSFFINYSGDSIRISESVTKD